MRRREFIALLGAYGSCIDALHAQPKRRDIRLIGFFTASLESRTEITESFKKGLAELGYNSDISLVFKTTNGKAGSIDRIANEIAEEKPDIVITWGLPAVKAMQRVSTSLPIVMASVGDPVLGGVVSSLAHPGGNITGFALASPELAAKRLQLYQQFVPSLKRVGFLYTPNSGLEVQLQNLLDAANRLSLELKAFSAQSPDELKGAIEQAFDWQADGLVTTTSPIFAQERSQITKLTLEHRILLASSTKEFVVAGALFSYGANIPDLSRRAATYVDKILKGNNPSSLPIQLPNKFELIINLKSAKALGLTVDPPLLAQADEVFE